MNRRQLSAVAIASTFATAAVLANGAGSSLSPSAKALALTAATVRTADAPPAAPPVTAQSDETASLAPAPTIGAAAPPPSAPAPAAAAPAPVSPSTPQYSAPPSATATSTATATPTATGTAAPKATPTPVASKAKHVFVIALTGPDQKTAFGPESPTPYLANGLRQEGALLTNFAPIDAAELPNYLAFAGGQKPTPDTRAECATYRDAGCVQPNTVLSVGDQVSSSGAFWKAYLEDMGKQSCVHPDTGAADSTAALDTGYVTRHNPFVYFHSLLDLGDCQSQDVDLDALDKDLETVKTTPALSVLVPATDPDMFLQTWVPKIQDSAAFKKDGVLIIATLANTAKTTAPTGALVLSRYAKPGSVYAKDYDPFALLHTVEELLGLQPLAGAKKAPSFAKDVLRSAF